MTETQNIPWKRTAVEAAAIVASILLAFTIDAGWQEHIEDQREHDVLIALLDDFEKSKVNVNDWREFHVAVQKSTTKLLEAVTASEILLTNDEVERLLGDLGWWDSQSHFSIGALNSLIYGGELSVIKDDVLRRLLAEWPSQINNVDLAQRQDYDFFLNVFMPFLRENGYLPKLATLGTPMPGRPEVISALIDLKLEGNWSHLDMVATEEFHNILVQKWWIQFDVLIAFKDVEEILDQTIQRIESRL
jgi:BMFP domain-containing protein YqiC